MNRFMVFLVASISACIFFTGCSTTSGQLDVVTRFRELQKAGELPGFCPDDRGTLKTQGFPIGHRMKYPASLIVYATRDRDANRYVYTFRKHSDWSEWGLIEAWHEFPDGTREDLYLE